MINIRVYIFILVVSMLTACEKDAVKHLLSPGKISIYSPGGGDIMIRETPVGKDSAIAIGLKAVLNGEVSGFEHIVKLKADTSHMSAYRAKYGNARVLPYANYLFYSNVCRIPAGASLSDSIQLNIIKQSGLKPLSDYVLPIVIQNVDGTTDAVAFEEVLFLVIKTGKSSGYSKLEWTIHSVSNQGTGAASNLLDNEVSTAWATGFYIAMPQNVVIDFSEELTFSKVSYGVPANYFSQGGCPTSVMLEVSLDANTWFDKGTYDGSTLANPIWIKDIGVTNARYLRFTVLSASAWFGSILLCNVGDISLVP